LATGFPTARIFFQAPFEGRITQMLDEVPLAIIQARGSWSNCSIVRERSMEANNWFAKEIDGMTDHSLAG
jgi:hypothetical protein